MNGCRALSDSEVKMVLNSMSGIHALRDKALFTLGVRAGFRVTELLSLKISDVAVDGKLLDRVTVAKRNTKGKVSSRSVVLHPEAAGALLSYLKSLGVTALHPERYVFVSERGENRAISRVQAWRILDAAFSACGLSGRTGTHMMRKTFAQRVRVRSGNDLLVVQKALGHKRMDSTVSYLNVDAEEIDAAVLSA